MGQELKEIPDDFYPDEPQEQREARWYVLRGIIDHPEILVELAESLRSDDIVD